MRQSTRPTLARHGSLLSAIGVLAAILVLGVGACDGGDARAAAVLDSLEAAYPCDPTLPPTKASRVSLSRSELCALVGAAMQRFRHDASDTPGLLAGDSAHVSEARITLMKQVDSASAVIGEWWVVTLELPTSPRNAEVWIDRRGGNESIRAIHKPIS
ncbi:MAG: hypothetical protein ACRDHF_00210 [Tepidiformaceae bacterium]